MMNLNKTEKLLAAKKKLKEFQLSKKQTQDSSNKHQRHEPDDINLQNNVTQDQKNEPKNGQMNTINNAKEMSQSTVPFKDTYNLNNQMDIFDSIKQTVNVINKSNNGDEVPNAALPTEKVSLQNENNNKEITMSQHMCKEDHVNFLENTEVYNVPNIPNDSSIQQKKHLLQMASAVANVLMDEEQNDSTVVNNELEDLNQVLTTRLQEQTQTVAQLHMQIAQYSTRISELEAILATKDTGFEEKFIREINPLKEQLQIHTQTTGILIAEKTELSAALAQSQATVKQNAEEIEELSRRMRSLQLRITELEKELAFTKTDNEDTKRSIQHMRNEYDNMHARYSDVRKEKEDLELEVSELKQKLNLKNTELVNLQQELQEKIALISLNEIKIQQLSSASEMQMNESQHHTITMLEQQLAQIRETLKSVNNEKDEISKQYQNYVRQLDTQHSEVLRQQSTINAQLEEKQKAIDQLETKEQSYIQRLSELEKQLQSEKERTESLVPLQDQRDRMEELTKNLDELMLEQERLHIIVNDKDMEIKALTEEIRELKEASDQNVEAGKLAKALESEQLGASRALLQNQQLKQQLNEMHDAFISLSNTKLDLTEQIQAERAIGRKLNAHLNEVENELVQLKQQLTEKDAYLMELEKEKLQNAQITDQMQHYQAQSQNTHTLQYELKKALASIENLKKQKQELIEQLNSLKKKEALETEVSNVESIEMETAKEANEEVKETSEREIQENINNTDACTISDVPESDVSPNICEPIKKLEERFKETMEKVAELTDEKQRLEHLVLQLQGETETIGEYITLYQKQRAMLQERAKDREQAYRQLIEQRNQQQEQLHKLKSLIIDLMKKKSVSQNDYSACVPNHTGNTDCVTQPQNETQEEKQGVLPSENETTSQLLDLLTEIKDCKDTCTLEPEFHLCPWCSGKLITV